MRRKLTPEEKLQIMAERYAVESAAFPEMDIEVVVEDFTYGNGEPNVRVIHHARAASHPESARKTNVPLT
jgi:hypothetical protein